MEVCGLFFYHMLNFVPCRETSLKLLEKKLLCAEITSKKELRKDEMRLFLKEARSFAKEGGAHILQVQ